MKLSAILAPLIAAKADHATIMDVVLAFEAEQSDALERRRDADRKRQANKRSIDKSRDITLRHSDRLLVTRAEDTSSNPSTPKKEDTSPAVRSRGSRIPDGFIPDIAAAVAEGLSRQDAEREARTFIDYWRARPGKEALKMDWPATWRVWFRKRLEQPAQTRSASPPRPKSVGDIFRDDAKRMGIIPNDTPNSIPERLDTSERSGQGGGTGISRRFAVPGDVLGSFR